MAKQTYKIKPIDFKDNKAKNAVITVLAVLLVFCIVCIFVSTRVSYTPAYEAVRENTELKRRINELEDEIERLNIELKNKGEGERSSRDNNIAPPNQHVEGYDEYQRSIDSNSDDDLEDKR